MTNFSIPVEQEDQRKHVGRRMSRVEDYALLKGQGQFVDDTPVKKNTLQAAFLRSPHAHAEIMAIDYSKALEIPGVFAIITGQDMAKETDPLIVGFENPIDYYGLAVDKVRHVGDPVAVVAALNRYVAEDALDLIKVEYKILPAAIDPVKAAAPEAPLIHPRADSNCVSKRHFVHGNPKQAFDEADNIAKLKVRYPRNSITPMETYAIVAEYVEATKGFDVLSNFQGPFSVHTVMALALRIRTAALRHRSPENSGGSFGSKLVIFPHIVVLCVLARKAKRPIKWIEDRLEHLSAASAAPNRVTEVEAAYTDEGIVTGLRLVHWDDHGAYLRAPMPAPIYRMHGVSTNGYTIRNLEVTNHIMITNKCPTGAVRGFGGPQLYFGVERMMQKIAKELEIDPLELMRRNLVTTDKFPYKAIAGALLDSGDYHKTIDETIEEGSLKDLIERREKARKEGRLYGIGYACCVEPSQSNMGYISTLKTGDERERAGPKDGAVACVTVSVDALGSVNVVGDSVPQGQGHRTALSQIVADQLGIDPENIVVALDTDTAKDGWSIAAGNYSCRFSPASASAADQAAERVKLKMARIAATMLNVGAEEIEFADNKIFAKNNPENSVPFYRVGGIAHWSPGSLPEGMEPAIRETAMWSAPELTATTANDEINTSLAYGFGFDFCGVEIDANTGVVKIDKYVSAHDCGTILNPGLAEGQIRGSWAAAYGATFMEEFKYDNDGTFRSGTFAEYTVPTAAELPDLQIVHPTPNPSPYTRLGAKGIAEGNQYSTPACIGNAVADALGYEDVELPLNPAKVLSWIKTYEPKPSQPLKDVIYSSFKSQPAIYGSGEFDIAATPIKVWDLLLDPNKLAHIVPGCESLETLGENKFSGTAVLGVGPVKGLFSAKIELKDLEKPYKALILGSADGPLGSSRGSGSFELNKTSSGTSLKYSYQVELSGTIASVGGRLVRGAARQLIDVFLKALARQAGDVRATTVPKRSLWNRLKRTLGIGR